MNIEELALQCWEARSYGPNWFDYRKFAKLIIKEQDAQPVAKPDGRLHDDGLFTWARRDGYVFDSKLPCDFYLSAQPQQATEGEI